MPSATILSYFAPTTRSEKKKKSASAPLSASSTNTTHRITKPSKPSKPATAAKTTTKISSSSTEKAVKTDVLLSIHAIHLKRIVERNKNHEYRKYRLRNGVERLWLYETALDGGKTSITHIAVIPDSIRRTPGTVPEEPFGIGNADFNAGLKVSKYGYPILELYELVNPVTLTEMKNTWGLGGAPMGWRYLTQDLWMDRWGENVEDRDEKVKKIF